MSLTTDSLTNVNGFEELRHVGGRLSIVYNDALTNLDGLGSLQSIGTALSFEELERVWGLSIHENPVLPTCAADWLHQSIDTIVGGVLIIENDDRGVCPEETGP